MSFSVGKTTREELDCFHFSFKSSMVLRIHMAMKFMFIFFIFVLRLSMWLPGCLCLGSDTILNGQSLFPHQTIISDGGIFEMGFFTPGNSSNYYVGIWYKNISEQTVVWVANRNNPISSSLYNSSRLELSNGELFLLANRERTGITGTSNATEAVILDTGNFILKNESGITWQSFDYPTDTWLPGATLGFRFSSDIETKLVSWSNPDDPAPGNYSLGIESNGGSELVIKKNDYKLWRFGVLPGGAIRNFINFTYVSEGRSVYLVYLAINESVISRIRLTSSGIMQQLLWSEADHSWFLYKAEPSDACKSYAICGANAICNIAIVPICGCLNGFVPKSVNDWRLQDFSNGCVRRQPTCSEENDFRMVSIVRLPENPKSLGFTGPLACQLACSAQCLCNAFAYGTTEGCLLFLGDLLDLESLAYNSAGRDLSVRMDTVSSLNASLGKGNVKRSLALIVTFSVVAVVVCSILFFYCRRRQKRKVPLSQAAYQNLLLLELSSTSNRPENNKRPAFRTDSPAEEGHNKYELPAFSFSSIAAATGSFSITNKLGEGGFGPVYKGELINGQFVAVKRLSKRSGQGLEEFKNETELIAKLQHRNLVGILGCCIENDEKILVYEYMPNKSLDFFLFDPNKKEVLDWTRRVCIIEGIAQGLLYLHHYSRLRIVHRDLKASNILLDAEMNPKISDFGMARIFGGTVLEANTNRIVGTYGYMSPEYAMDGVFSIKSDVYAFGVLMLEIISGRKNSSFYGSDHLNLLGYAWNLWTDNHGLELIELTLECHLSPSSVPLRYIQIGLLCVQENPGDRPTMSDVVAMFNKEQTAVATPKHPAFIIGRTLVRNVNPGENKVENCSVNGMTLSLMEAR